jgi:hypothetical protein
VVLGCIGSGQLSQDKKINGPGLFQLLITVANIGLTFAGSDTYGEVNSGRLRLHTTPLIPCTFENRDRGFTYTKLLNESAINLKCSNDLIGIYLEMGIFYLLPVLAMLLANRHQKRELGA